MSNLDVSKIQPTRGYVLVEPAKSEEKTSSGIILPESDSEKPQHGTVLAVGESGDCCNDACCGDSCCSDEGCAPHEHGVKTKETKEVKEDGCCGGSCGCGCDDEGCCDDDCAEAPVKVGDKVIYKKWGGNDFKIGDTEYQFLKFEDILAVIK